MLPEETVSGSKRAALGMRGIPEFLSVCGKTFFSARAGGNTWAETVAASRAGEGADQSAAFCTFDSASSCVSE